MGTGMERPTDRDGRVTRETDLEHNQAEHTADALSCGVSCYCGRVTYDYLPSTIHRGPRPRTAGILHRQF
jgi:hypothetical protein